MEGPLHFPECPVDNGRSQFPSWSFAQLNLQPQNTPKELGKPQSKGICILLVGMVSLEGEIQAPTCFFPAGPEHRGELGGGHPHGGAEDCGCQGEEVQRARALPGPRDGRPQCPLQGAAELSAGFLLRVYPMGRSQYHSLHWDELPCGASFSFWAAVFLWKNVHFDVLMQQLSQSKSEIVEIAA